jgi:DNA-binding MarR family transcriptional regulator
VSSPALTAVRLAKVVEIAVELADLTVNQYRLLSLIESGQWSMQLTATRLAMKPPNVSVLVDLLEARGLVERRRHSQDRRVVELVLSARGAEVLADAHRRAEEALSVVAGSHPRRGVGSLMDALEVWRPALDAVADRLHDET